MKTIVNIVKNTFTDIKENKHTETIFNFSKNKAKLVEKYVHNDYLDIQYYDCMN